MAHDSVMLVEIISHTVMPATRNGRYSEMFWFHSPAPTTPTAMT
jgi:hypothetical protein